MILYHITKYRVFQSYLKTFNKFFILSEEKLSLFLFKLNVSALVIKVPSTFLVLGIYTTLKFWRRLMTKTLGDIWAGKCYAGELVLWSNKIVIFEVSTIEEGTFYYLTRVRGFKTGIPSPVFPKSWPFPPFN